MIVNPNAKTILCYGDSNTWGQSDDKSKKGRYKVNQRWTGTLQETLGNDYYIIEEGLGGRTTNLDQSDKPFRNGLNYFIPCLVSHSPDIVILMLGTNDLKVKFKRSAEEISTALGLYIKKIREFNKKIEIILISPIIINSNAPKFLEYYYENYNENSAFELQRFSENIYSLAQDTGCLFLDANTVAKAGIDGIHFDKESHINLAEALKSIIKKNL